MSDIVAFSVREAKSSGSPLGIVIIKALLLLPVVFSFFLPLLTFMAPFIVGMLILFSPVLVCLMLIMMIF